jgi:hypothetical protein
VAAASKTRQKRTRVGVANGAELSVCMT